jgi:hypothetical protein
MVWTIKVATRALTHKGNLNVRFHPLVYLVLPLPGLTMIVPRVMRRA